MDTFSFLKMLFSSNSLEHPGFSYFRFVIPILILKIRSFFLYLAGGSGAIMQKAHIICIPVQRRLAQYNTTGTRSQAKPWQKCIFLSPICKIFRRTDKNTALLFAPANYEIFLKKRKI